MKTEKVVLAIVIAFLAFFVVSILFNGYGMMGYNRYGYGMMTGFGSYGFGFMWIFGLIFMILVIIALVLFILWLARCSRNDDSAEN